jgi:hypothetical protein
MVPDTPRRTVMLRKILLSIAVALVVAMLSGAAFVASWPA